MSEDSSRVVTLDDLQHQRPVKVNPHAAEDLGLNTKHIYKIPEFTISGDWSASQVSIPRIWDVTDGVIGSELHRSIKLRVDHGIYEDTPTHILYTQAGFPAFYLAGPRPTAPAEEYPTDRWLFIAQESE